MAKRIKKISKSLKQISEIQVNDWELPSVLKKDISEFEIRESLQRLGNMQVTDWQLKDLVPALQRLSRKEVDVIGLLKQATEYKVIDWERRDTTSTPSDDRPILADKPFEKIIAKLQSYLEFTITPLIDEPRYASFHHEEIAPHVVRFMVVLKQRDLSMLVGSNGRTSGPIRRLLKDAAQRQGVEALLQIKSHEEAAREAISTSRTR